jgi:hypothetical protein
MDAVIATARACAADGYLPNGISQVINAILVKNGVRPATLLDTPESHTLLMRLFPDTFEVLNHPWVDEKFLIQKGKVYTPPKTHLEVGELLGYPCAKDFEKTRSACRSKYLFEIIAHINVPEIRRPVQIFSVMCLNQEKKHAMQDLAQRIHESLTTDSIGSLFVNGVEFKERYIPSELKQGLNAACTIMGGRRRRYKRRVTRKRRNIRYKH